MPIFKECQLCGIITDYDELKCPGCGNTAFKQDKMSPEQLFELFRTGEVTSNRVRTKRPSLLWRPITETPL